jgi:protein-tyrosine phosphatase
VTIQLEGVNNFRDFGALLGMPGQLFRSGHLAAATATDIAALKELGLAAIIDLRRPSERAQRASPPDLSRHVIMSEDGDRAEAPHLEFLRQGDTSDEAVEAFLLDYYRKAPFEPRHVELFARAFRAIGEGPILIHCTAGKDRTGILAALILAHHGAAWDVIVEDFLRTNSAMLRQPHLAEADELACRLLGRSPGPVIIRAMLGVEARHLAAAFDAIRARTGDIRSYLAMLGAGPERGAASLRPAQAGD